MEFVSETASADDWTCEIRMRGGRLPDRDALSRSLETAGQGATLRGIEAVVVGWLSEQDGELWLRLPETGERLRLAPLRRKVQWDVRAERAVPPSRAERAAYAALRSRWRVLSPLARVTGPILRDEERGGLVLEVRDFRW